MAAGWQGRTRQKRGCSAAARLPTTAKITTNQAYFAREPSAAPAPGRRAAAAAALPLAAAHPLWRLHPQPGKMRGHEDSIRALHRVGAGQFAHQAGEQRLHARR